MSEALERAPGGDKAMTDIERITDIDRIIDAAIHDEWPNGLKMARGVQQALDDAGYVVMPKEATETMASAPERKGQVPPVSAVEVYRAMRKAWERESGQ